MAGRPRSTVALDPIQDAYRRSGLTPVEFARLTGTKRNGKADSYQALRNIGLKPITQKGRTYHQRRIGTTTAMRYASVLGLDPIDIDC